MWDEARGVKDGRQTYIPSPGSFSLRRKKQNGEDARGIFTVSEFRIVALGGLFPWGGSAVTAGEFLDASSGIDEFLLPGEEGMASRTDADLQVAFGAAGMVGGPTGAMDGGFFVVGMNICFHSLEKGAER